MNSESTMHRLLLSARIPASIVMALAIIALAHPSRISWLTGVAVISVGEAVRIWASGHIQKNEGVAQTGPYALCRHPLYMGHSLIATGFCIAADSMAAFIIVSLSFLLVYMPTWKHEEAYLISLFGDTYRDFMRTRPAIFPRWNQGVFAGSHSWQLVKQHRELNHVAGLLAGVAGMALLSYWRGSW